MAKAKEFRPPKIGDDVHYVMPGDAPDMKMKITRLYEDRHHSVDLENAAGDNVMGCQYNDEQEFGTWHYPSDHP